MYELTIEMFCFCFLIMLFLVKKCQLCDGEAIHEILKKHKLARTWEQNEQQMIFGENMKTMIISQHC